MIQMERLHGISSFSGLTPASSMPSDLIRGSGQAPNPDLYIVVIVRLDRTIQDRVWIPRSSRRMTEGGRGMTEGGRGMTEGGRGMTEGGRGMT